MKGVIIFSRNFMQGHPSYGERTYFVEPIGNGRNNWGDVDPATGKITGIYGDKYTGSVLPSESIISEDNNFKNIKEVKNGSPYSVIEEMDREYPSIL